MQKAKTFQDWMRLFDAGNLVYLGVYLHNPNHHEEGKDKYRPYLPLEVANAIHGPTPASYGCVVVQPGLESLPGNLEGRTIEINTEKIDG